MGMNGSRLSRWRSLLSLAGCLGGLLLEGTLPVPGASQTLELPPGLVAFDAPEGQTLLLNSEAMNDFWPLSMQFVTQVNQAYCGVASLVMVLNGLEIAAPESSQYAPYRVFTQENFFDNADARRVITPEGVARQGITLEELGGLLQSYGVNAQVVHSTDTTLDEFRRRAVNNLDEPGNFILVNYLRREIGQERGGHISPLAAYDQESDRFLLLDVARYKYPPVWVRAEDLWRAMNTVDSTSGQTRGFVLVGSDRPSTEPKGERAIP